MSGKRKKPGKPPSYWAGYLTALNMVLGLISHSEDDDWNFLAWQIKGKHRNAMQKKQKGNKK